MFFDYLYEFAIIVQCGSMRAAALKLGISQPTLSRHVSALETQFGQTLLEKGSAGVRPTVEGRFILENAHSVVEIEDSVLHHFCDPELKEREGQLYIGGVALPKSIINMFGTAACKLSQSGKTVSVRHVDVPNQESACALVESKSLDIAVVQDGTDRSARQECDGLVITRLAPIALSVQMDAKDPLANNRDLSIEEIGTGEFAKQRPTNDLNDLAWKTFRSACNRKNLYPMLASKGNGAACTASARRIGPFDDSGLSIPKGCVEIPIRDVAIGLIAAVREEDHAALAVVQEVAAWKR